MSTATQTQKRIPSDVKAKTIDRLERARMGLGWKFPFFFPAIARTTYKADVSIPTACVDLKGVIRVNPLFAAHLSDQELVGVVAHEHMHLVLLHLDRMGNRKPMRWNRAADRILNSTLRKMGISLPESVLYAEPDQEDWTAEQLYEVEPECDESQDPRMVPVGAGCGPLQPGQGDSGDEDGNEAEGEAPSEEALRRQWREVAAQCHNQAKAAGTTAGNALADLLDIPPPRVRWAQVLRGALHRAVAEAGRDDVSWSRRSRRSTPQIILPGGVTHKCRAAVVIDTSGSMSDEDLAQAVSEVIAIVNNVNVPVFFVAHDHAVQAAVWIYPGGRGAVGAQVKKNLRGRGGTSFEEAYERVGEEGRFSAMVHLTDGGVYHWPQKPVNVKRLVVALLGYADDSLVPEGAKIIEAQL